MENVKQRIIKLLKEELPSSLMKDVDETELLIMQEKYRQAYLKMDEIRKSTLWTPSSEYLQLMEKFWWNCAN
ncbi:MAG: hypothetical protein OSJ72_19360 [Lachnospiraceae bacterium]|nr:hypothetical protein [Lachnospiraceae bacterium]